MSIERSHGDRRPRTPKPGDSPLPPGAELSAPIRNPRTGRFTPGNSAYRLRALKAGARHLIGLDPAKCAPWARDFVALANADARRLVEEHGIACDTALVRLAENAALTNAVARAMAVLGVMGDGDRSALAESKAWFQEYRQELLSLKGEAREAVKARQHEPHAEVSEAEVERRLGRRGEPRGAAAEPQPAEEPDRTSPSGDVAPAGADDTWIDASPVEAGEPTPEEPAAASRELTTEDVLQRAFNRRPAQPPAAAGPCSHGVPGGTPASCAACARIEQHVNGRRSDGMCPHGLNPQTCLECFKARQAAAERPGGIPWREGLPRDHPDYRGPRR